MITCVIRYKIRQFNKNPIHCSTGDTAVVAGVYGPVEAKPQKMMHDRASVETIFSPATGPACENIFHHFVDHIVVWILYSHPLFNKTCDFVASSKKNLGIDMNFGLQSSGVFLNEEN